MFLYPQKEKAEKFPLFSLEIFNLRTRGALFPSKLCATTIFFRRKKICSPCGPARQHAVSEAARTHARTRTLKRAQIINFFGEPKILVFFFCPAYFQQNCHTFGK
jgi:hypothetical protein